MRTTEVYTKGGSEAQGAFLRMSRSPEFHGATVPAATKSMLVQLEAMEGRFERAIELVSQAVQQLEQLGYSQAEQARGVLRTIEQSAPHGSASSVSSSYGSRPQQTLTAWKLLSPAEQSERLAKLAESSTDPVNAVLTQLAHSAMCCQHGDIEGCDAAISQAKAVAEAAHDHELLAFVASLREQLDEARSSGVPARSLLGDAVKLLQDENFEAAETVLAHALAQARAAGKSLDNATCQFCLGQFALMLDRPVEAVKSLREALELATQVGETDLIHAVQDVLTVATRAAGNQ